MTRREPENSSFELFLDTICNTFGGIVFLAILLALMIQTRAVVKSEPSAGEQMLSPDETREYVLKFEALSAKHAQVQAALQAMPASSSNGQWSEFQELDTKQKQLNDAISDLVQELSVQSSELAEMAANNAATRESHQKLPDELSGMRNQLKALEIEYVSTLDAKVETLRLPRSRSSAAPSIVLLVQGERVYLAYRPSLLGSGFHLDHIDVTKQADSGTLLSPRAGAGWSLDAPNEYREVLQTINHAGRAGQIVTIAIWPDAYDRFGPLREHMIEKGIHYQLWVQDDNERLVVYDGAGSARVQ